MNYRNSEMKIDQLVGYLNEEKINLSPAFQRGHVWKIGTRRRLLRNIVQGKPIPAVFLYKEASGSKYSYNILDGKQRLESLILFIGSNHGDLKVRNWDHYFFGDTFKKDAHFWIELPDGKSRFHELEETVIRDFREYAIPTIEISLDDDSSLDEIITLFVDINQQGVPVNRFDIVKAMCKTDPTLKSVLGLLAIEQKRKQDVFYKMMKNDFTFVLKRLQIVDSIAEGNAKVDRMWEKLLEIAIFLRTRTHRKPVEILKGFISPSNSKMSRLNTVEIGTLRKVFKFLKASYSASTLGDSRFATDQTHFYIMVTSLINSDLLQRLSEKDLRDKLAKFAGILDSAKSITGSRTLSATIKKYKEASAKQTTDAARRSEREKLFVEVINEL